jgi:hypothetical protein
MDDVTDAREPAGAARRRNTCVKKRRYLIIYRRDVNPCGKIAT